MPIQVQFPSPEDVQDPQRLHLYLRDLVAQVYAHAQVLGTVTTGATAQRPPQGSPFPFYDSTLQKMIFWSGNKWVDAAGAKV